MFLSLSLAGSALFHQANRATWVRAPPVWYLKIDANSGGAAALNELNRRLTNNNLSSGQIQAIVNNALTRPADTTATWPNGWGDFVEKARAQGAVSQADWKLYAEQAATGYETVMVRKWVRKGDPVAYRIVRDGGRVGSSTAIWAQTDTLRRPSARSTRSGRGAASARLCPIEAADGSAGHSTSIPKNGSNCSSVGIRSRSSSPTNCASTATAATGPSSHHRMSHTPHPLTSFRKTRPPLLSPKTRR